MSFADIATAVQFMTDFRESSQETRASRYYSPLEIDVRKEYSQPSENNSDSVFEVPSEWSKGTENFPGWGLFGLENV